jgi:hypothetical protein
LVQKFKTYIIKKICYFGFGSTWSKYFSGLKINEVNLFRYAVLIEYCSKDFVNKLRNNILDKSLNICFCCQCKIYKEFGGFCNECGAHIRQSGYYCKYCWKGKTYKCKKHDMGLCSACYKEIDGEEFCGCKEQNK